MSASYNNGTGKEGKESKEDKEVNLAALLAWVILRPDAAANHIYRLQQSSKSYDDMLLGFRELFVSVIRVIDDARRTESENHNSG